MRIVVTVPPLVGLATQLAPAGSQITGLMPPGRSEHGYEFTPGDLDALAKADLVFFVGMGLEPKVEQFVRDHPSTRRRTVCFAEAVGLAQGEAEHHVHDHEHHDHSHAAGDPHLWLDPALVAALVPRLSEQIQAASTAAAIPDPQASARAAALLAQVNDVDAEYRAGLAPFKDRAIVTHHNAWQRLADRYGLRIAAVIRPIETSEPTPDAIAKAVDAIKAQNARAIFIEPQFNPESASRIGEAAGAQVFMLDPLGTGDWAGMMRANLDALVKGLSPR